MATRDHILGLGGVGMSALAQVLLDEGYVISGADRLADRGTITPVLAALQHQGVMLYPETGAGIDGSTNRVIASTAIEETNPGLVQARHCGVKVVHRAVALSEALAERKLIAVAGTCGKSTVTAILGHLLAACGFDPLVVNGAQVVGWDQHGTRVGAVRPGQGDYAVAEVDESDKSLVAFHPAAVIVTNASADHYSCDEMNAVFDAFIAPVTGPVVDGRILLAQESQGTLWNIAARCPMPGAHNRANAFLALTMAQQLGADVQQLAEALTTFPGVERRLQKVGACAGAVVYDDYAHNPEKLAAMLTTLQAAYPRGVAVLWRPHGYGPLRKMLVALAAMFTSTLRAQDVLVLVPVYDAGGTADRSVNADQLAARVPGARYLKDLTEAEEVLRKLAPSVGAIVSAGARDPGLPVLARHLAERND